MQSQNRDVSYTEARWLVANLNAYDPKSEIELFMGMKRNPCPRLCDQVWWYDSALTLINEQTENGANDLANEMANTI
jgi:hypothetical protein